MGGGYRYSFTLSLISALDGGWVGGHHHVPGRFTPRKDPVPIVQEAGWAIGPVWTGAEYPTLARIDHLDRPACSQSLYRPASLLGRIGETRPEQPDRPSAGVNSTATGTW